MNCLSLIENYDEWNNFYFCYEIIKYNVLFIKYVKSNNYFKGLRYLLINYYFLSYAAIEKCC